MNPAQPKPASITDWDWGSARPYLDSKGLKSLKPASDPSGGPVTRRNRTTYDSPSSPRASRAATLDPNASGSHISHSAKANPQPPIANPENVTAKHKIPRLAQPPPEKFSPNRKLQLHPPHTSYQPPTTSHQPLPSAKTVRCMKFSRISGPASAFSILDRAPAASRPTSAHLSPSVPT